MMNFAPICWQRRVLAMTVFLANLLCSAATLAGPIVHSDEAQALSLIKQAQQYIKANGMEKSFAEFNRLESPFNTFSEMNPNGDLYLYTVDFKGLQLVHGKSAKIRGTVSIKMRDINGVYLIREMAKKCKAPGKGWVEYVWPNPLTKRLETKKGYIERIPGSKICLGTGIYLGKF